MAEPSSIGSKIVRKLAGFFVLVIVGALTVSDCGVG